MSDEQINALRGDAWRESPALDEREKAIVHLADKLTRAPASVTDGDVQPLRKWFGEAHLVELNLAIGTMNLTNRFNLCFDVALEETEASRR